MINPDYAFDDDLFGLNLHGLASHLEPVGWSEVNLMKRAGDGQIVPRCPASDALARALCRGVRQRRRWGYQLAHGGWATVTQGESAGRFRVRHDEGWHVVEPSARALTYKEVRRALFGRSLAVGSTDRPVVDANGVARAARATCLRIDTDQDEAWALERHEPIFAELRAQERAALAMGLPFLAFATGGRGFQTILRLPAPLLTATASLLSRGLRMALRTRVDTTGVHVDRDAFDGLMRLPGGIHRLGRTGLFIDVEDGRLHPVPRQASLLSDCLEATEIDDGPLSAQRSLDAERALLPVLCGVLGSARTVATEEDVIEIVRRAPKNPLCEAVLRAHAALGVAFGKRKNLASFPRTRRDEGNERSIASCDGAWAQGVWSMEVQPGRYWEWVHMGGQRGMLAAVVLFGEGKALERLQEKAASHRAASPRDQRAREFVNASLWRSFGLKGFRPHAPRAVVITMATSQETAALSKGLAARAKSMSPSARWSVELLETAIAVVLAAIEASSEGEAHLSVRDVVALANAERGEGWTNATRVHEALGRVCAGPTPLASIPSCQQEPTADPLLPVFVRVTQCRAEGERSLFLPGPATYGTHVHRRFWKGGEFGTREHGRQ